MINRKLLVSKYHASYRSHSSMVNYVCFYCNSPADGKDHVPPLALVDHYPDNDRLLVRCCALCNNLLSKRMLLTMFQRCEFLRDKYLRRWKKDLDMPHWDEDEIDELQGQLKREVIKGLKRKERAIAVINNLNKKIETFMEEL